MTNVQLNGRTRLYPLLGDPIIYARSPDWLSKRMAERGMNMISLPMQVPDGQLAVVMAGLAATGNVDGLSLTMPHKIAGYELCATVSDTSRLLGVISAIRRNKDGSWHGHTTDGDAFVKAQIDNGATISRRMHERIAQLQPLIDGTTALVTTMAAQRDSFQRGMNASARFTAQLDTAAPVFLYLTDHSPTTLASVRRVMDTYRDTFGATLANLATVAPIIGDRTDSLDTGLTAIPYGLNALASIVKNNRADFSLVATQGPVCTHDIDRRAIGDITPVQPNLVRYCPPAPDMQMRGAVNAPRPNDLGMQNSKDAGGVVGPPVVADQVKIPTLAEVIYKWRMILKGKDVPR